MCILNHSNHTVRKPGMAHLVMILAFLALLAGCHRENPAGNLHRMNTDEDDYTDLSPDGKQSFTYRFTIPDHKVLLPPILREISGIAVFDSLRLAGVQDEYGRVFIFRISDGLIEKTIPFSENGDYEDIVITEDAICVLKSNGTIYSIKQNDTTSPAVTRYKTRLSARNDCEGLCYMPGLNSLLIACKGSPSLKKDQFGTNCRAIYKFSFETCAIDTVPFITVNMEELISKEPLDWYQGISARMANRLSQNGNLVFQPSGIAVHPVTGNLYILAHIGKMVLITDERGKILGRLAIDPAVLPQPEGICFDANGVLFIASEGVEADGVLTAYRPKVLTRD